MKTLESSVVEYLRFQFQTAKDRNPRYSLRSFAKKLNLPPGNLSEIFAGKRTLKFSKAEEVLKRLAPNEKSFATVRAKLGLPIEMKRIPYDSRESEFLFDWVTHMTLGFFELGNSKVNAKWISRKIGYPEKEIQKRIDQLHVQGHLIKNKSGHFEIPERGLQWNMNLEKDESTRRRLWEEQVRLAQHAVSRCRLEDSHFSSVTFLGSKEQVALFQSEILKLYDRLTTSAEVTPQSELIRVSVQAFPIDFKN